ncbi:MAG: zinc ribbon domain-containing protein [Methanoregula sp.]|nr:zinc ribbon domain-containing protein [Methanoregula sp.]
MSYPELYSDERVVLQAQNVKVKSVSFEVVLTTRRLVLIDTKKHSIPPQEINLATLKDVESGENAIRDPTITISIITISGNTRQMVLTFSKTSGGERRRECDDWVRALRQNITSTIYHPVSPVPPPTEPAPSVQPAAPAPHRTEVPTTQPPKKRIEVARPMKKIVEAAPAMPVPIETTSLPTGSFCNRCGNRVPPESVFCNRCGTPIAKETESVSLPSEKGKVPLQQPSPVVPQVAVTPPPVISATAENKDSRIEEVIHTIEPLIEDSVPRTAPAPLVPSKQSQYPPADIDESAGHISPATGIGTPDAAAQGGEVKWPVLTQSGIPDTAAPSAAPVAPPAPGSPPPMPPRKIPYTLIAVLAVIVLAVIAGAYVFMQSQTGTPGVTQTPGVTVPATTVPKTTVTVAVTTVKTTVIPKQTTAPSVLIPKSGVWVKISYSGKFSGDIGTPGRLRGVEDSGEQFYQISTTNGPVVVSIQKSDGSSAELAVDVYNDGTLMKHAATTTPRGIIEFEASVRATTTTTTTAP